MSPRSPSFRSLLLRRTSVRLLLTLAAVGLMAACDGGGDEESPGAATADEPPRPDRLRSMLSTLAADSMEGRRTGTEGAHRAARFLAAELERYGVEPAGDDGYFQRVPMARVTVETDEGSRERLVLPSPDIDFDTIPDDRILESEVNVVGILEGSDPDVSAEAVVVGAHYDHVGIGRPVEDGVEGLDSIYNGADDDGSGTVAVLEIARTLARGDAPRRTVVFLLSTGEEVGLLGTRWYVEHPVVPLERTVADLQIEMIGRPDSLADGRAARGRGVTYRPRPTPRAELLLPK
jgi:acetylornithine deacetylase/succinyl-diaminopimelate desuccinylase-like protein